MIHRSSRPGGWGPSSDPGTFGRRWPGALGTKLHPRRRTKEEKSSEGERHRDCNRNDPPGAAGVLSIDRDEREEPEHEKQDDDSADHRENFKSFADAK
jgi:hypothetical protein